MRAPSPLTMRQALNRGTKAGGSIRWYLEHAENNYRVAVDGSAMSMSGARVAYVANV